MYSNYLEKLQIVFYCLHPVLSVWESLKHTMEATHESYGWKLLKYTASQIISIYESNICPVLLRPTRF